MEVSRYLRKYGIIFLFLAVFVFMFVIYSMDIIEVKLVHPSEAITVLRRLNREQPDRTDFRTFFRSGSVSETTACNWCLRPNQQPLCNYTDLNTGESWFCFKPKNLSCNTRITHFMAGVKKNLKANEEKLFQSGVNLKVSIQASGPAAVTVLPNKKDLKEFNLYRNNKFGPLMALDLANDIMMTFRGHGPPIISVTIIPVAQMHYVANELDGLTGGTNTVVVVSVWAHFCPFPIQMYIRRIQDIRRAVVRLLDRAPGTLVIIRTANLRALSLDVALLHSDWYALHFDKVLKAMFKGLNVHLVDAWEMSLAHHVPHEVHPLPPVVTNMIDVLLSYICPQKGG
uniref:NXPE family member 3-like n=1 Tax=Monopterus albus TaxID=43700 RepID=UPI0009B4DA0D|nr:NXPE family member 3-like [Monopterus albus]